jgi:hypothetical protein
LKQPDSIRMVLDMLLDQVSRYLPENAKKINLKGCLEGDVITEPLGALISSAQRCAKVGVGYPAESSAWKRGRALQQRVLSMVELAEECELSDFDLNKASNFSDSSVTARANLLLSLYVACTETIVGSADEKHVSERTAKRVCRVFEKYTELLDAMQKKGEDDAAAADGKKKKKAAAAGAVAAVAGAGANAEASSSSNSLIEQLIGAKEMFLLLEALAKENQDNVSQLFRDNKALHRWIVSHLLQLATAHLGGAASVAKQTEFCESLGALIMTEYKRDNEKDIGTPLAEALFLVIDHVANHSGSQTKLAEFLEFINPINKV